MDQEGQNSEAKYGCLVRYREGRVIRQNWAVYSDLRIFESEDNIQGLSCQIWGAEVMKVTGQTSYLRVRDQVDGPRLDIESQRV